MTYFPLHQTTCFFIPLVAPCKPLLIIGMVVLTVKLVALTLSVTWGLTKTILFGVGLPVILAVLFIAGLTAFAVPMLILALLGVFLLPLFGI